MNHSILRWVIVILGLFTAGAHLSLNIPFRIENAPFTLNGLGYLSLLGALFLSPSLLPSLLVKHRKLVSYGFMGFAVVTIVGWVFLGKPYTTLGYVTKADEVLLILALWLHSRGTTSTIVIPAKRWIFGAIVVDLIGFAILSATLFISGRTTVSAEDKAGAILMNMKNTQFVPDRLEMLAGEPTRIVVKNSDFLGHTITIEELGIDYTLGFGSEQLIELPPLAAGEYSYICTVPGHEHMKGTLVVTQ